MGRPTGAVLVTTGGYRVSLTAAAVGALVLGLCGFAYAEEAKPPEKSFNPADPTAASSHLEVMPEYNQGDDYSAPLLRLIYDIDWGEGKYSITTELPYGRLENDDGTTEDGLGDMRLRYFHRVRQPSDEADTLQTVIFSLDAFLPTGDSSKGLGLGTFLLAPTVIFELPLSERWTVYPMPKLKFSMGKTEGRSSAFPPGRNPTPGRESEEYIFAAEIETSFVYMDPDAWWIFANPIIEWDLLPEPDEDNYEMTLKSGLGKMFGRWGLGAEGTVFVAGEKSQDYQARLIFFYYF